MGFLYKLYKENNIIFFITFLISILPASLLFGTLVSNLFIIIIDILIIAYILRFKLTNFLKQKIFYFLVFFWFGLILNFIFSEVPENSAGRAFGFIRFIILFISIIFIFNHNDDRYKKLIISFWSFTFLIVFFDLLIEFFSGENILGFSSNYAGRLSGFTGEELKIGNFFTGFAAISIVFFYYKFKNLNLVTLIGICILILSFLIGERANFIKFFLIFSSLICYLYILEKKFKLIAISGLTLFILSISLYTFDKKYNDGKLVDTHEDRYYIRYIKEFNRFQQKSLINYLKEDTRHGGHFFTALNIFYDNKLTGVGIKNFRLFSSKEKYIPDFVGKFGGYSTHPHQIYFEILSEMGILGLTIFIIFFMFFITASLKKNHKAKNLYGFAGSLYVICTFLPLIPSGSFFTSFSATIFWLNFSIMNYSLNEN